MRGAHESLEGGDPDGEAGGRGRCLPGSPGSAPGGGRRGRRAGGHGAAGLPALTAAGTNLIKAMSLTLVQRIEENEAHCVTSPRDRDLQEWG